MVIGRLRKTLKRSLSIAMAAALMVTSVPEFSAAAMAQEEVYDESTLDQAVPAKSEEGTSQDENLTDSASTEERQDNKDTHEVDTEQAETKSSAEESSETEHATQSTAVQEEASETETSTERHTEERTESELESERKTEEKTESESETERKTEMESQTETVKETEEACTTTIEETETESETELETEEKVDKNSDADKEQRQEEEIVGKLIYENDFDSMAEGETVNGKKVVELAKGNKAVECEIKGVLQGTSWEEMFTVNMALEEPYQEPIKEKVTIGCDIYVPTDSDNNIGDIGTMKVQLVLVANEEWTWFSADTYPEITAEQLVDSGIDGYLKKHISIDIAGSKEEGKEWDIADLAALREVNVKVVGDTSTYQGKLYLDNVVLKDTSTKTDEPNPDDPDTPANEVVFYENNFNEVEKIEDIVNVGGSEGTAMKDSEGNVLASVAELAAGNKAIKFTADLSDTNGCIDLFKAEIDLPEAFTKTINEKVVMSYDLYFPEQAVTAVGDDFGTMTALPGLKSTDKWTWVTSKQGEDYDKTKWAETSDVDGYKVFHVEVNMNAFKTWDNDKQDDVDYAFSDITPIKAVIPCLAGKSSKYQGDIYLDNLKVKAVGVSDEGDQPSEPDQPEKPDKPSQEGKVIYENNFDELTDAGIVSEADGKKAELTTLADGNKAIKFTTDLSGTKGWTDIFKAQIDLPELYTDAISEKVVMSYDVYFPETSVDENFKTIKAQAALKAGEKETWISQKSWPQVTKDTLEDSDIAGYKVFHVEINMNDFQTWNGSTNVDYPFEDIIPIKTVIPCLGGDVSGYVGDVYLDNLVVRAVGEEVKPEEDRKLIYKNNFDELTDLNGVLSENVNGANPTLTELVADNKAVKYSVKLTGGGWKEIFKAKFGLDTPYDKTINSKVVMSYDVYFPEDKIGTSFDSMKAQAALISGTGEGAWVTAKTIPELKTIDLEEDTDVPGFKKAHIEIDMNDLETWDSETEKNVPYPFDKITPVQAVIPCFVGAGSTYEGDLYLDNLEVWAVNEGNDTPVELDDLVLNLDQSAWEVLPGYQYNGESSLTNKTVGDKDMLVLSMDYTNDSAQGWSEAKFKYTHPSTVEIPNGYNAFVADIYYKPTDISAGSLAIKIATDSPKFEKDDALPESEPTDIPELKDYNKAEFILSFKVPKGTFENLTLGFVGKNTNFKGDVYLDNLRFTQLTTPDVYVDSTLLPEKGAGIKVVDDGRSIQTASGNKVAIAEQVALADANANEATKNLYAYLKAVGESDSVIFGHQNDTHHKAGSAGEGFSTSDTEDVTGSIAGIIGIDTLSLTGNEASTWDAPEADRIANVAEITRKAAAEGALITVSAHMPNFDVIDKRVKAYEASGEAGTDSDTVGYWVVNGEKQYNFSGYTPNTLTGNVVERIMPGKDLNYLYTDYLDMIADYAKAVEGDGITILFRPLHENTGSWFWWGAALCDEQAYIALYRYTVDYLKETKGVHNMLYVYGPGSEAANVAEYGARYPGDAYVDMIGYDLYHSGPSQENEAGYLQSISKQNGILRDFATAHNKLYAITETGVADKDASGADIALRRTGNEVMDWYMQLLDQISDEGVCYFLVWANFSENGSFYLPFVTEKKENGILHGHEMIDEFIRFYNDDRSVFATDMNNEFKKISSVTNTTEPGAVAGYIVAPQSGDRLIAGNGTTRIAARISGEVGTAKVQFIAAAGDQEVLLEASYNEEEGVWEAQMTDEELLSLGEIPGAITLMVGETEIAQISARFNLKQAEQNDLIPEDFENYAGSNRELNSSWTTNKDTGSEIILELTQEKDKVFGGKYGMQMNITLAKKDAWVGATKSFEADWTQGNALELYTIPEAKGQKVVVQVKSGAEEFEVYLQEYEEYTKYAATGTPVKVTIPFGAFVGKSHGVFDPAKIQVIGLWCNALPNETVEYPLSTTICYDEMRVVTTDQTAVQIQPVNGSSEPETPTEPTPPSEPNEPSGSIITPRSGDRLTTDTRIAAKVSNVDVQQVTLVVASGTASETLSASYNQAEDAWEAVLADSALERLGNGSGTIRLMVNGKELDVISVVFGVSDDVVVKRGIWVRPIPEQAYTGSAIKPEVKIYDDGRLLTLGKDYTLSYKNNVNAGMAKVIIKGKGNYGETIEEHFTIKARQMSEDMVTYPEYLGYNGKNQKISVTVKDGSKKLGSKDYTQQITYNKASVTSAREVGVYQIRITGTGNYTGVLTLNCEMVKDKLLLSKAVIKLPSSSLDYTEAASGAVFDAARITVKMGGKVIPQQEADGTVNYTIRYANNKEAGTAASVIAEAGAGSKYVGKCVKNFKIKGLKFSTGTINVAGFRSSIDYTGASVQQNVTLTEKSSGKALRKDKDYHITYSSDQSDAGKMSMTITGCGKYSGTIKKTYTISRIKLAANMLGSKVVRTEQSRGGAAPDVELRYQGKRLVRDKDYTLSYTDNTHITSSGKKAYISITGKGNFTGKLSKAVELQIVPKSFQSQDITIEVPDLKYSKNKKEYKPNPVVTDNGGKLVKGKDYTVAYESNTRQDVGSMKAEGHVARAIITVVSPDYADGTANDKRIVEFRIIEKMISSAKVELVNPQYFSQNGTEPAKSDLRVTYQGASLSKDDYEILSYAENTKKGKATLVIQGKRQYGGTKTVTFNIQAKKLHQSVARALLKIAEAVQ